MRLISAQGYEGLESIADAQACVRISPMKQRNFLRRPFP